MTHIPSTLSNQDIKLLQVVNYPWISLILLAFINFNTFSQGLGIIGNGAETTNSILDIYVTTVNKGDTLATTTTTTTTTTINQRIGITGLSIADEGLLIYNETLKTP